MNEIIRHKVIKIIAKRETAVSQFRISGPMQSGNLITPRVIDLN